MGVTMHSTIPDIAFRLRQGRAMRGFSLRDLADKTGAAVSHTAIARYEKGEMMPGSKALLSMARALDQPIDYFFRPARAQFVSRPRFRKALDLPEKEQQSILESATDYFDRYYEIEEILDAQLTYAKPLPDAPEVRTPEEAAKQARALRGEWNLGCDPLPNIHELMELKGIKVFEAKTNHRLFDGLCSATNRGPVVVIASWLNENLPRKRMTEIHELAHVVMNIPDDLSENDEEKLAWSFAGELLLPEEAFRDAFGEKRTVLSIAELVELKKLFGASIMAMIYRARTLGLIEKPLYRAFWSYAHTHQWKEKNREPGDELYQGNESHSRFRQLVLKAVLEEKISMSKGAGLLCESIDEMRLSLGDTIAL
jgi:Zn-dependent peptidase ImmA (M78 family)/DNA-binding XRE family transcriptional regulator